MLKLYGMQASGNCYKVRLVLTQLGIPFQWLETDIRDGATRTASFLAMNPNGRVPLLEIEPERFLAESNAIIFYLADGGPLLPDSRYQRAQVLQWLFFEQYSHEPYIATSRYWIHLLGKAEEYREALEQKRAPGYAALDVMEQHLTRHAFFVGERYGIADIGLYAYTHVAAEGGFELENYPGIRAWLDRVRGQPGHVGMMEPFAD